MLNVKNTIVDTLLSFLAPHLCSGCGRIGTTFCDNCKYDIINEPVLGCIVCEKPVPSGVCNDHKSAYNQAWIVGVRSGALQRLIGGFKFRNMKASSYDLADLLHKRLPPLPRSVVFVPIPTTPTHIRERGYDHMLLVTKHLAGMRGLPYCQMLSRGNVMTQHHANRKERLMQASTAFILSSTVDPTKIYIIIDDVVTTGATIQQASLLLKNTGATVWVAAIARQPLD